MTKRIFRSIVIVATLVLFVCFGVTLGVLYSHYSDLQWQQLGNELTIKDFAILRLFLQNPGKVFYRETLMHEVWGEEFIGESRTVDMHIKTLRQKLGEAASCIKTVVGIGYRMEAVG